ncbi:hypothetical protein HYFRA_00000443 [Hymenoscyphus fraxineus]|uniref:Uncharacterized protein n=1 Tax=Hymenoscyphus fraxineus TaxID=746836 RepID=A0A9N9L4P2_9HELO|nr:hypothetical protein HYFRA_00000443 [Hymenoscyphus fraxineus]
MGNSLSDNSYLNTHDCGARNVTWKYIHNFGKVPIELTFCPSYNAILSSHCCWDGFCTPHPYFDPEFHRYQWRDWNGLGDPYLGRTWPWPDFYDSMPDAKRIGMRSMDRRKNQTQYTWGCNPFFYGGWDHQPKAWIKDGPEAREAKRVCEECVRGFRPKNPRKNVTWVEVRETWVENTHTNCTDACDKIEEKDRNALVLAKNRDQTAARKSNGPRANGVGEGQVDWLVDEFGMD